MSPPANRNLVGILLMFLAVGLLSLMDAALKGLSPHYPPMQIAALRGMTSFPLAAIWVFATVKPASLLRARWGLHLFRGVLGVGMMASFIFGLRYMPLTTAYTLFFVAPLIITALSVPFLGERVSASRWIAIGIGFVGVLVVLRPTGEGLISWAGLGVLGAATGYAISAITVRVLARTDSTQSMVFWLLAFISLGAGLLAAPHWVPLRLEHAGLLLALGLCGALGQVAITEAFIRGEASVLAPIEYVALAWGLGFDLVIWQVLPDGTTLFGAAIIVASGLFLMRRERVVAPPPMQP